MTRERGTIVYPINLGDANPYAPFRTALGIDPQGTVWLICSEGVGNLLAHTLEPQTLHDVMVGVTARESETLDLADFIRTHNARLDSNFYAWHRRLNREESPDIGVGEVGVSMWG